jgi:hypothetical protein
MFPSTDTQDLPTLAKIIRNEHRAVHSAGAALLHHAMAAGDALITAQAKVAGNWKLWLRENCFLGVRTALIYVRLARHRAVIEAELGRVGDLSLRAALRLIAEPRSGEKTKKKTAELSLIDYWKRAPATERTIFLDAIGIDGIRRAASFDLFRKLRDQLRIDRVDSDPNTMITNLLRKALSHIAIADAPQTSGPVAAGNVAEALNSLRGVVKKLSVTDHDYHDIEVGIARAARAKRQRAA